MAQATPASLSRIEHIDRLLPSQVESVRHFVTILIPPQPADASLANLFYPSVKVGRSFPATLIGIA